MCVNVRDMKHELLLNEHYIYFTSVNIIQYNSVGYFDYVDRYFFLLDVTDSRYCDHIFAIFSLCLSLLDIALITISTIQSH